VSCLIRLMGVLLVVFGPVLAGRAEASGAGQSSSCDVYVDNGAGTNGDGSFSSPWNSIPNDLHLPAGETLCVRGNTSGPGRIYNTTRIELRSSGTATAPITLRPYPGESVVLQSLDQGGVIKFIGDYWTVQDFVIDNMATGWRAIILAEGADHNVVRGNEVYNGTNHGIDVNAGSRDNRIEDNHVHHFSRSDGDDAYCIHVGAGADNTVIQGNTIHDCSGHGIRLSPPADSFTNIPDFADNVQILGNLIYEGDLPAARNAIDIKAASNLKIIGNELYGYEGDDAVTLHYTSRNTLLADNRIHDSGRGFRAWPGEGGWPEGLILQNNLLYDLEEYAILLIGVRDATIVHNTIVNAGDWALNIAHAGLVGGTISNNLVVNSGPARIASGATFQDVTVSHNGWFNSPTDLSSATDTVGGGDPGFVNLAGRDLHLDGGSPALGAGADVGVGFDFEGDERPGGCCPDLGADEYNLELRLSVMPSDQMLRLSWNQLPSADLASFTILYSRPAGASNASEGAPPILNVAPSARSFSLTGLSNYKLYSVTVVARDHNNNDLAASNTVAVMPSDLLVFLPLTQRSSPSSSQSVLP
jgi:hypothetical protein